MEARRTTRDVRRRPAVPGSPWGVTQSLLLILLPVLAGTAAAEDIWLLPASFTLKPGEEAVVRQVAGTDFAEERDLPFSHDTVSRLELVIGEDVVDLLGTLGDEGTSVLKQRLDTEGGTVLAVDLTAVDTETDAETFLAFVKSEGFNPEFFQRRMKAKELQRRRHRQTLKSFLRVGRLTPSEAHRRILGQDLEITLLKSPISMTRGNVLAVRVLFEDDPLAHHPITIYHATATGEEPQTFRIATGPDGIARFVLAERGAWVLRLFHIRPSTDRSETDWESFQATYSFSIR